MGKVVGLVGAASGKIGNIVYAVTNGIQTARVYQPIVSNPKSNGQSLQRAKGNLAGRISSFVPRTAIMGLGVNNRQRRGEFLRNLLKMATTTFEQNSYVAKIQPADVLFSKGSVVSPVLVANVTAANHLVSVVLSAPSSTIIEPSFYDSHLVRVVIMVFEKNTSNLMEVSTKMAVMPAQGSTATTSIQVAYNGDYDAFAYVIPMSTDDGSAASITTSMVNLDDDKIAAALSKNESAVVFNYGRSVYGGTATYTSQP